MIKLTILPNSNLWPDFHGYSSYTRVALQHSPSYDDDDDWLKWKEFYTKKSETSHLYLFEQPTPTKSTCLTCIVGTLLLFFIANLTQHLFYIGIIALTYRPNSVWQRFTNLVLLLRCALIIWIIYEWLAMHNLLSILIMTGTSKKKDE